MKSLRIPFAVALVATALTSFALSPQHEEWGKGAVKLIMTAEETSRWKAVKTDADAEAFIALFWARRDPTPETRRNEYRELFDARVRSADEKLAGPDGQKGSLTDRGRTFILFGQPTRVRVGGGQRASSLPAGISAATPVQPSGEQYTSGGTDPANPQNLPGDEGQLWIYEGETAQTHFNAPKAEIRFVDRHGKSDFKMARGTVDYAGAQKRAIERSLTQPNLTEAPKFPEAAAVPVAPAPVAIQTELTTDAYKAAVTAFKADAKFTKKVHSASGEFITADGTTFVPVMLVAPKGSGFAADSKVSLFGVIEDESGKRVLAFEEPVRALTASKDDLFIDKSVILPAGKYAGTFGLAENGEVVAMTAAKLDVTGTLTKEATATSPLILANNAFPMLELQRPDEPFAFGGVKFVPRADKVFRASDEIWYFVEVRNPGLTEGETPAPALQFKIDVTGKDATGRNVKRGAPLTEVIPTEMKGVPGHYGVGSSLPAGTLGPGDYTFNLKLIDTVKKTSWTLTDSFKVVE